MSTSLGPGAASVSQTTKRLKWETDTDFNKGTVPSTLEVSGTGDAAVLQTKAKTDNSDNIPFTTAGNYTLSNGSLLEIAAGLARLSVQSGDSADFPFTTASNYTLGTGVEVTGGVAKLEHDANIVGAWDLNESSGTNAPDTSDNGNDGTLNNMADSDWVSGQLNNGLQFANGSEYVSMGDVLDFERTDAFSIEFWMKRTGNSATEFIVSKQIQGGNAEGYGVFINTLGVLEFLLVSTTTNLVRVTATTAVDDNTWHHVVVTYDGSSAASGITIYLDNSSESLTTVNDTLTTSTLSTAPFQFSGRSGANLTYGGTLDAVKVWDKELTSGEVSTQYNSGTGTEDMGYSQLDPTVVNNTGLSFSTALDTFTETATKPSNTAIQYHVSSDNGVTWEYWTGAAWATTDNTFAQSNTAADIQTNIGTLAASGTFKFRALLRTTDGINTPELDRIQVSGPNTFSTTDNLYVETKDASQINPTNFTDWLTCIFTSTTPGSTDLRVLFSVDDRVSWLTWSGSAWVAPTSDTTRTDATSLTDAATNFSSLPSTKPLDVRVFIQTSDNSVTPSMDNIAITSNAGFETSGTYETNQYDSTELGQEWGSVIFNTTEPSGTSITIKGKAANSTTELTAASYGSALSNNGLSNLTGQYIQFEIAFTGTSTLQPQIDNLAVDFDSPLRTIEAP